VVGKILTNQGKRKRIYNKIVNHVMLALGGNFCQTEILRNIKGIPHFLGHSTDPLPNLCRVEELQFQNHKKDIGNRTGHHYPHLCNGSLKNYL